MQTVLGAEVADQAFGIGFGCFLADMECIGDFAIGHALSQAMQDVVIPVSEVEAGSLL